MYRIKLSLPILARPVLLRFGLDHALLKQGQDEGKLLFAFGMSSQDPASLLGFTTPLPISMRIAGSDHRGDLLVGIRSLPLPKFIKP